MVDFLDRDRRSNSVLHGDSARVSNPPRRPNFAQNMHPNKRCRRSLARPNRTTPEYHDVNHCVAVGRPRWLCIIEPIAFVGGMGGWCCWTWCAVVFVVVLVLRGAGGQLTNKHKWVGGEGKICTILFDTKNCFNNPPSYFRY
jgi:hypothetical protein